MEKTLAKTGLPTSTEKYVYITRSTILHRPTIQTATLLNENKQIHAQMHQRHKPNM